jgi:Ca2+-transporting ATPase
MGNEECRNTPPVIGQPVPTSKGSTPLWHALDRDAVARTLDVSLTGLGEHDAAQRLERFGPNRLEPPPPPSRWMILVRQFRSPLIYVLLAAALIALALGELSDAAFIGAVLVLNAGIGFVNELRAEREVHALFNLVRTRARVRRGGHVVDVDGEVIVPGDLILLESGARVSADVRLVEAHALRIDESLLTGESLPVEKDAACVLTAGAPLGERLNMAFAGSMVTTGRGLGLVVATALSTEVGKIAGQVAATRPEPPPLVRRMERFARLVGTAALILCGILVGIGVVRGQPFEEVLLSAIALAVSAIPEGLPIALTVALAIAVSRMARRGVVVRHLPAVEALGSCGVIATDKTGTLTQNELTVERAVAGRETYDVSGIGYAPEGELSSDRKPVVLAERASLFRLVRAASLANEASLSRHEDGQDSWEWSGDPTDVAFLALGIKAGTDPVTLVTAHEPVAAIPFEPEHRYAASFHRRDGGGLICVKGAPERVIAMCSVELDDETGDTIPLDRARALASVDELMRDGRRVLAVADAETPEPASLQTPPPEPSELVFLGLVAMTDPPRERVDAAIARCRKSGIQVVMVTGDHATTARAIAARIGLGSDDCHVLTSDEIARLDDDQLTDGIHRHVVVARATPADKLRVVRAWQRRGAFVAVTGDGVNDAPALRQADLGVAMGRAGTDVAREAADLVITDDDFSSIVAGIEEGRVAYDNVRNVTYLLVSTGAGEVLAVTGALALGLPVPFTAVQLLWLNLVTNGIQDVALAFEPGEPGVLERPPRPPGEGIFDRLMIERTLLAGLVFGGLSLACWAWWTAPGRSIAEARNLVVQLFVLFEIFHIGNSRSETRSMFRMSPFHNPVLLGGTLAALGVHVGAMYTPFFQDLLGVAPLAAAEWLVLGMLAMSIVAVMETHKWWRRRVPIGGGAGFGTPAPVAELSTTEAMEGTQ